MRKVIPAFFVIVSASMFSGCTADSNAVSNTDYVNYTIGYGGYNTYTPYYWDSSYLYSPGYGYTYWGNGYNSRGGYYRSGYGRGGYGGYGHGGWGGYGHGGGFGGHGGHGGHR